MKEEKTLYQRQLPSGARVDKKTVQSRPGKGKKRPSKDSSMGIYNKGKKRLCHSETVRGVRGTAQDKEV